MEKASKKDSTWLIGKLEQVEEGSKPVLIQEFTKAEIEQHWLWGGFGVSCELVMESQQKGVLIYAKPLEERKIIRVGYIGALTLVSILVVVGVCFG